MTRCIVISPDVRLRSALIRGVQATPGVALLRSLDHHPQAMEAGRLMESLRPDVVLIEASAPSELAETARRIEQLAPDVVQIGVYWDATPSRLVEAMHAGVRDFVSAPFAPEHLAEVFARASDLRSAPERQGAVYSFVPVKEGVGASTIAIATAAAIGRRKPGECLLMDMDFAAGVASLALQADADPAAWRGLARSGMDDALWPHLVTRHGGLDVVAAPMDGERAPCAEARLLLRAARTRYNTTAVDLPGLFDSDAIAAMKQSHVIFLVTTPELPALRLAHERLRELREERLDDRVEVLLNRAGAIPGERIEDLLGYPVFFEFPNDYRGASAAIRTGRPEGALGKFSDRFAATLLGDPLPRERSTSGLAAIFGSLTARFGRGLA